MLALLLLIPAYAFADRFAGGGWPDLDDKLPGRGAFWGALLCAALGLLLAGPAGALFGLAWLIWRTPAWKLVPGSSATPRSAREIAATFIRHAIPIPLSLLIGTWTDHDAGRLATWMVLFALAATALAALYAKRVDDPEADADDATDANHFLETVRGAVFGLCVVMGLA